MKFYNFHHNTPYERQWTMAVFIHPRSRIIEWSCPDCGASAYYPAGSFDVTIEDGNAFPDILGCGAYPLLIVSGRVIDVWEKHHFGPILKYPVGVTEALETTLLPRDAPPYFRVEVCGAVKVDIPGSKGKYSRFCTRCASFMTDPMIIKKFAVLPHSWDGSPLFRDQRLFPSVNFCTEEVMRISETERLTNFCFEEMIPMSE